MLLTSPKGWSVSEFSLSQLGKVPALFVIGGSEMTE